jgi:hypothetical protein
LIVIYLNIIVNDKMIDVVKLKRGDKRSDGMVFWAYEKKRPNGERWITQERFDIKKSARYEGEIPEWLK